MAAEKNKTQKNQVARKNSKFIDDNDDLMMEKGRRVVIGEDLQSCLV